MSPPDEAVALFGERFPLAARYAEWLVDAGITRGLLGPREADQIWHRHLLNGVGIAALIPDSALVVDLGSGAGLPGIPLLLARPDLDVVLVEPKARRAEFLVEVCRDLGLTARVVRARATPTGLVALPEGSAKTVLLPADAVTARAVSSVADLGSWAAALLRHGGQLLAVKGVQARDEVMRDRSALAGVGMVDVRVLRLDVRGTAAPVPEPLAADDAPDQSGLGRASPVGSNLTATVIAMRFDPVSRET